MSKIFLITRDNKAQFAAYTVSAANLDKFNAGEIGEDLSGWPVTSALDVAKVSFTGVTAADFVRALTGDAPARFKTTAQIQERVWAALTATIDLPEFGGEPVKAAKPAKAPKEPKAAKAPKEPKPAKAPKEPKVAKPRKPRSSLSLPPKDKLYACRAGTKQAALIDALSRPNGATLADLRAATDKVKFGQTWRDASIRSALSHDVNTVKGYGVRTEMRDGEPVFFLVYPKGFTAPVPHK